MSKINAPFLFDKENVSAYYLEFDDERSGGFVSCEIIYDLLHPEHVIPHI